MNCDTLTSCPKERNKRLGKKYQCKELTECKSLYSHLKPEKNETLSLSASSLQHTPKETTKKRKSSRHNNPEVEIDSNLSSLVDSKNVVSMVHKKQVLRKSTRLSLISNNNLAKLQCEENPSEHCSKSLNLECNLSDNKSSMHISPEEITDLFCSVSLAAGHSISAEGNVDDGKQLVNNLSTSVTFSPVCSSQNSIADDLNNSVANIIEILAEDKTENKKLSRRPSNSSPDIEDSNAIKNILKGVTAYVEVRSGHENRTKAIERELHRMGAKIVPKFLSTATHVIFKDGRKSTRDKALARDIPLVSVLWVESCKQQRNRVPEADFPANIPEIYDSPVLCRRIRKLKSMQPKDFNTEFAGSIERLNKIFSRIRQNNEYYSASDSYCGSETSASIKGDDTASDDNDQTPVRCNIPAAVCRLFGSSRNRGKVIQCNDEKRVDEIATSSKYQAKDSDPSAVATEVTVKRRKLFSDLNQSPQLITTATSPKCAKKKIKSNTVPRKKKSRNKTGVGTVDENIQTGNNQATNLSISIMTDNNNQHKDMLGSDMLLTNLKQNSCNSLDDFDFDNKIQKKEKCFKTNCLIGDSFDLNTVDNINSNKTSMKKPAIVLTSLQSNDREIMYSIIESLGGFQLKHSVTETTTHVVSGDNRRTLSVLFGLVRGCWLLSSQWVYKSMEAGHWLEEEPFQLNEYCHASQISHLECASHGPCYRQNLFSQLGNIFVSAQCVPSFNSLIQLIKLAGGKVSSCLRKCEIIVGPHKQSRRESKSNSNIVNLSEKWILDCISQHKTLPFDNYRI